MAANMIMNATLDEERLSVKDKRYLCSTSLFCGNHEIIILHGKEQYRLRVTRQNRLILTK